MWLTILTAIALLLVIEGIVPFLSPQIWRQMMVRLISRHDRSIRLVGLMSLVSGALLMYVIHSGLL